MEISKNPMKASETDIVETIGGYLKKTLKVKYTVEYRDSNGVFFQLNTGLIKSYIHVEYNETDDWVNVILYTEPGGDGVSLYEQEWENIESGFSLEDQIDNLISTTKRLNKVVSKISSKVDDIMKLCYDNDIDYENFISVNYYFD
jgi:hypothetical protein